MYMNNEEDNQNLITNIKNKFKKLSEEKSTTIMLVAIYAVISEFWIVLSDKFLIKVLSNIADSPISTILKVSAIKGSIYVILSSTLLYLFILKSMIKIKGLRSELQVSEERYCTLIKLLPDAVTIIKDDKYIFTNNAGAKLFGFNKPEQISGVPIKNLVHPEYHKMVEERIQSAQHKKIKLPLVEQKYNRTDGTTVDVEITSCMINYNGQPSTLSVVRDITERKKIEKVLKKTLEENTLLLDKMIELDKIKTEFFSNISHEFKTPLNIIFGIVQLLNTYTNDNEINLTPSKLSKYTGLMKQNCYRLLRLINNLIDITKIDSGFLEMNCKNHNIISVIENISLSVAEFAKNKGISLIFDTEVEEKIMACDTDKIERIILNLLSNSIKFTKPGGNIYINIYDNKDSIAISIKDTGIGIPEDKLKIIFERFIQVDSSLQRENEGSGIGLALVKSLVSKHGGQISVESKEDLGTEFIINFPINVLATEVEPPDNNTCNDHLVEKIHIEFSDIYSNY